MKPVFKRPTYGSAATLYDMGVCQNPYTIYIADGGSGRTVVTAVAAAEAAATAATAAVAAANAAQQAAYAANAVTENANAVTSVNHNRVRQGHQPFPARRRKLRLGDSRRKMPHQEGWHSFTWDCNWARSHKPRRWKLRPDDNSRKTLQQEQRLSFAWDGNWAQSHKQYSDGYGAERGFPSKSRSGLIKQWPQHHIQPQQQWRVKRNNFKGGYIATASSGHRTTGVDWPPQETVGVSTQTLSDEATGSQAEPCHDEVVLQPQHVQFQ